MSSDLSRFYCNYAGCARSYKKKEHLLRHERDHLNLRPFACMLCPATFNRSDLLKRHEAISHQSDEAPEQKDQGEPSTENAVSESQKPVPTCEPVDTSLVIPDGSLSMELEALNLSSNPTMQLLQSSSRNELEASYFLHFHPHWPLLHKRTFLQSEHPPELTAAVLTAGLWVLDTPETKDKARFYHDALLKVIDNQLFKIRQPVTDSPEPRPEFLAPFQVLLIALILCTYRGAERFPSALFNSKHLWRLFQSMGVYDQKAIDYQNSSPIIRECYQRRSKRASQHSRKCISHETAEWAMWDVDCAGERTERICKQDERGPPSEKRESEHAELALGLCRSLSQLVPWDPQDWWSGLAHGHCSRLSPSINIVSASIKSVSHYLIILKIEIQNPLLAMAVAVAGGTGGLGRALVDAIKAHGKHEVLVLSRKNTTGLEESLGARVVTVDYSNVDSLASILEERNIEIVISAVNNISGDNHPEINLIRAADKSETTKRFIPSYFGTPYTPEQYESFPPAMAKKAATEQLEATSLEWTKVYNGYFLDYYGTPKLKSYMDDISFSIDMRNNFAALPGSGEVPVVFTHTFDVARFVAAALDLPVWERTSWIIGDRITWNDLAKQAQDVKGVPFHVTHDSIEALKAGVITELPSHPQFYDVYPKEHLQGFIAACGVMCEKGQANFTPERSLNELFPDIKPMTARDVLEKGWGAERE
ncbi:Oxidoreductase BOA1 [Fusarium oxysporum f. sp. raphani]|nr:Oxidoreductase BOA1 [Fusarium oxysporum f. sp. raphani]